MRSSLCSLSHRGCRQEGRGSHSWARHPHVRPEIPSRWRDGFPVVCQHAAGPLVGGRVTVCRGAQPPGVIHSAGSWRLGTSDAACRAASPHCLLPRDRPPGGGVGESLWGPPGSHRGLPSARAALSSGHHGATPWTGAGPLRGGGAWLRGRAGRRAVPRRPNSVSAPGLVRGSVCGERSPKAWGTLPGGQGPARRPSVAKVRPSQAGPVSRDLTVVGSEFSLSLLSLPG